MKYRWKTKPYAHQVKAIRKLIQNGYGGALLMEPRTGKTKTVIDYLSMLALAGKIDRAVVIAPNRVLGVWVEEFLAHSPIPVEIQVWDKNARKKGPPHPPTPGYRLSVVIVNYQAFGTPARQTPCKRTMPNGRVCSGKRGVCKHPRRRGRTTGRFLVRKQLIGWLDQKPAAGVLDESHKIKSASGKASNMIVRLGSQFTYRLLLTGTPVTKAKRAHDIYMQWKFLNPARFSDYPTLDDFRNQYGRWISSNGYPQWIGPRNQTQLRQRIHLDSFAIRRDQCFDLPPRDEQIISVDLTTSATAYDDMAEDFVARLKNGEIATASIKLVQTLRLAQITGGMVGVETEDGSRKVVRIGREKLIVLEELLDDLIENEEKVVICARFRPDLNAIVNLLESKDVPTFQLRGGMKREDSDNAIRSFRNYSDCSAFVMQPNAGSLGIDLSSASRMIWYSLTPSWVDYSQACDRIALSRKSTTFTYLLAKGTVDEVLYQTMQEDGDVARAITQAPESLLRLS